MSEAGETQVFVFETTHHALWAEDIAREQQIPAEVVPAPSEAKAKCGLALQTVSVRSQDLRDALTAQAIPFEVIS